MNHRYQFNCSEEDNLERLFGLFGQYENCNDPGSTPIFSPILSYGEKTGFSIPYDYGYVYLMWAKGQNIFKIGKSNNPFRRHKEVSKSCLTMPFEIVLIGAIYTPFMSLAEKLFHEIWVHRRMQGEWFRMSCLESAFIVQKKYVNLANAALLHYIYQSSENKKELYQWLDRNPRFSPEFLGCMSIGLIHEVYEQEFFADLIPSDQDYFDQYGIESRQLKQNNGGSSNEVV